MRVYSDVMDLDQNTRDSLQNINILINSLCDLRVKSWQLTVAKRNDPTKISGLLENYHTAIKLTKAIFKVKKTKIKSIGDHLNNINEDVYSTRLREKEKCETCRDHLVRYQNFIYCQRCKIFKSKIYLFKDDEADDDIKQNKTNIPKHFEATLNKIYGSIDEKMMPSDEAIRALKQVLDDREFNIHSQVHYTKSLMDELKKIGEIKYGNAKKYNFGAQLAHTNHFLQRLYPNLEIPKLTSFQRSILENTFLKISSEFQQLYPALYSSSYQYTIHRILHMTFPKNAQIRLLLRFIYLQGSASFLVKDEKLNNINNNINCFRIFAYLPDDIYTNAKHYEV